MRSSRRQHASVTARRLTRALARASQELEDSLACQHTAMDAALALNRIYGTMQERAPQGGRFLRRWARVLLRPEIRHVEAACEALEQALLGDPDEAIPSEGQIQGVAHMTLPLPHVLRRLWRPPSMHRGPPPWHSYSALSWMSSSTGDWAQPWREPPFISPQ